MESLKFEYINLSNYEKSEDTNTRTRHDLHSKISYLRICFFD